MIDPRNARLPLNSVIFGYGAIVPLVIAAVTVWVSPPGWWVTAIHYAVIWAALILTYVGGVRRGFGFATPGASTAVEIAASLTYFALAGLALMAMPYAWIALWPLMIGFVLVALLDRRAAMRGLAPAHFARLRVPQYLLGTAALAAMWARVMI